MITRKQYKILKQISKFGYCYDNAITAITIKAIPTTIIVDKMPQTKPNSKPSSFPLLIPSESPFRYPKLYNSSSVVISAIPPIFANTI